MHTVDYMRALADETRLRCFRLLAVTRTGLCVAEFVDILRKPQYAVSRALGELRKAGLVTESRRGKLMFYAVREDAAVLGLGEWAAAWCVCESGPPPANPDGSLMPGGEACAYDMERFAWRMKTRGAGNEVLVTYRDPTEGGMAAADHAGDGRVRVLFVCVHNSARSQFAEEYLRALDPDGFHVESAGLTPGILNPLVVEVLASEGIDISRKATRGVVDLYRQGRTYDWVITVCSREAEENCPVFPGPVRRLSWPFEDPAGFGGSRDEALARVRELGTMIRRKVGEFAIAARRGANPQKEMRQ